MDPHHSTLPANPPDERRPERDALAAVVRAASAGDARAWATIVDRFTPALKATARGFRLSPADVEDVVQSTWLAAVRHLRLLRSPDAIGGWLLTTARREALRTLQRQLHEIASDGLPEPATPEHQQPEEQLLAAERDQTLHDGVRRLPPRQRQLLHTLLTEPGKSYADLSASLRMPVGSIGPTRDRGLARLRHDPVLTTLHEDDAAA
jgi:RNA polymerase sigma factor (sigma-70 family)